MNVFISYTTRDEHINKALLQEVAEKVSEYGYPYIDILHNTSNDKQSYVEYKLFKSDLLILLNSDSIEKSNWAQWEIKAAKENEIPIIKVPAFINRQSNFLHNLKNEIHSELEKLTNASRRRIDASVML